MQSKFSWTRFYNQCKADLWLWGYFILGQQVGRIVFIIVLANYLAPPIKVTTILTALLHGLRFDSLWATCWLFVPLGVCTLPSIVSITCYQLSKKLRQYWGGAFTISTALIYIASIEYYREFKDLFNQFLFGWFYDDKVAIIKTVYAEHHLIIYSCALIIIFLFYLKYSRFFTYIHPVVKDSYNYSGRRKTILTILLMLFYVVAFRGSIGRRPIQLKDAGVTTDKFLNKAIVSPYSALKYAIADYRELKKISVKASQLPFPQVQELAQKFFLTAATYPDIVPYLQKSAQGPLITKPKHILLIVGESLDAWPLAPPYNKFNLVPNLRDISKNSLYFKYFLSCTYGTMETLNTIITGIPDAGMHINYQPSSSRPFPTALAPQLARLGYRPQFFYGGYLSWQRLEDFAYNQGFAAVYGAAHIKNWQHTNEWGVDDRILFDFVRATLKKAQTPTFNIIMTTSNHPPFSVALEREADFDRQEMAALLAQYPNANITIRELGHIWYADKTINEFINRMVALEPSSLFIITGDHFGRRHLQVDPPLFDKAAVPLIIYSEKIKEYCAINGCHHNQTSAGSHLDLGATLLELLAPPGFLYYSMGDNLLKPRRYNLGIGKDLVITPAFIVSATGSELMELFATNSGGAKTREADSLTVADCQARFAQVTMLARYLIARGGTSYAAAAQIAQ